MNTIIYQNDSKRQKHFPPINQLRLYSKKNTNFKSLNLQNKYYQTIEANRSKQKKLIDYQNEAENPYRIKIEKSGIKSIGKQKYKQQKKRLKIDTRKNQHGMCDCCTKNTKNVFLSQCQFKEINPEQKKIGQLQKYVDMLKDNHRKEIRILQTIIYSLLSSFNKGTTQLQNKVISEEEKQIQIYKLKQQNNYLRIKYFESIQKKYSAISIKVNNLQQQCKIQQKQQSSVINNRQNPEEEIKEKIVINHLFNFEKTNKKQTSNKLNKINQISQENQISSIKSDKYFQKYLKNIQKSGFFQYYDNYQLNNYQFNKTFFSLRNSIKFLGRISNLFEPLSKTLIQKSINKDENSVSGGVSSLGSQSVVGSNNF